MHIGSVDKAVFETVLLKATDSLLSWCGEGRAHPQPKGQTCEMTLIFMHSDDSEKVMLWKYGSESQGPPPEVCAFVSACVEATEPWYQAQRSKVNEGDPEESGKWWQFWK